MDKPEWTKTKGFRLPKRTLDQLEFLVEKGAGRNATEVVIIAIERLTTQYEAKTFLLSSSMMLQEILRMIDSKTGTSKFMEEAIASLPECFFCDRKDLLKTLTSYWKEEDIETLKDRSDEDLRKIIAIRMNLSNEYLESQLGCKSYY